MRLLALGFFLLLSLLPVQAGAGEITAAQIVSGDTILLKSGETLRVAGIHAPLADTPRLADQAEAKLRGLAEGRALALENIAIDRYGHLTADVYALSQGKKIWIAGEMLKSGLVFFFAPAGDARAADLIKAEDEARKGARGIWADKAYADTPADEAIRKYGRFALVSGTVVKTGRGKSAVYLDFGPDWHRDFAAAIAAHDMRAFRDAGIDPLALEGKVLRVRGWVRHDYGPTIILTNPAQIEVLAEKR